MVADLGQPSNRIALSPAWRRGMTLLQMKPRREQTSRAGAWPSRQRIISAVRQFRAMQPDADGLPKVGRTGRCLGIRVGEDIAVDSDGWVQPGVGGMSVSPGSMWNVPSHRRPRGMAQGSTGHPHDRIYAIEEANVTAQHLALRPDPENPAKHAFVEPSERTQLDQYEQNLVYTRPAWRQAWPQ